MDGMRQGKRNPFSLLLGVALSECPSALTGNFTVFPGSHHTIHSLILDKGRLRGVDEFRLWSVATDPSNPWCAPDKGVAAKTLKEAAALRKNQGPGKAEAAPESAAGFAPAAPAAPAVPAMRGGPPLLPDLGTPKQLMLHPGDVIVAHPKLAHRGAPNFSPNIRYMCYFRLRHISQQTEEMQGALVNDMWADLEGITPSLVESTLSSMPAPADAGAAAAPASPPPGAPHLPGGVLSLAQIDFFRTHGFLVVPGVLSPEQVAEAQDGMRRSLLDRAGVDASSTEQLQKTKLGLRKLSSTNGAGGVLDLFYERWKLRVTLENETYATICKELFASTYASYDNDLEENAENTLWAHPYGKFDPMTDGIWAHVDRMGFRVPDSVAEHTSNKKNKKTLIQRSLTPHLDCCPTEMHAGGGKVFPRWRPIQCFLSLSHTTAQDHGGFECVPGFHKEFEEYYAGKRPPRGNQIKEAAGLDEPTTLPCVGDYVHVRPNEDAEVIRRFVHVPVPAGAAVFWDQRLPHANARWNKGKEPRSVVYGGFLPRGKGIFINQAYAKEQLRRLKEGRAQPDFWLHEKERSAPWGLGGEEGAASALFASLSGGAVNMLK